MTRNHHREHLPSGPLSVVNIGLEVFAENLKADGIEVVQVDWRPPTGGDPKLAAILAALEELDD